MTLEDAQILVQVFNEMISLKGENFWDAVFVLTGFLNDQFPEFEWFCLLETTQFVVEENHAYYGTKRSSEQI